MKRVVFDKLYAKDEHALKDTLSLGSSLYEPKSNEYIPG
jgi:hypothetical protein